MSSSKQSKHGERHQVPDTGKTASGKQRYTTSYNKASSASGSKAPRQSTESDQAGPSSSGLDSSEYVREHTVTDKKTKVATNWQVMASPSQQPGASDPNDPSDPDGNGRRNLRRIGETSGKQERLHADGYEYKKYDAEIFVNGLVFETLLVPPPPSLISDFTPLTNARRPNQSSPRKFVVIRKDSSYNGHPSCLAVPINTYQNRGVAAPGVVKGNHVIAHTTRIAPEPMYEERPRRQSGNGIEDPLLRPPIRVKPRYHGEGYSLDPMARINFGSLHAFSYGAKIRRIGNVHSDSMTAFENDFRYVWRDVTPQVDEYHASQSRSPSPDSEPEEDTSAPRAAVRFEDASTEQEVLDAFEALCLQADRLDLPHPQHVNAELARAFAANLEGRQNYMDGNRQVWNRIIDARRRAAQE